MFDLNISFSGKCHTKFPEKNGEISELLREDDFDNYISTHKGSHISVHCNPSKDSITIKRTIQGADGQVPLKTAVQVLSAFKSSSLFAPVIFRACGTMQYDTYSLKETSKEEYIKFKVPLNPAKVQLRYIIVVSWGNTEFTYSDILFLKYRSKLSKYYDDTYNQCG